MPADNRREFDHLLPVNLFDLSAILKASQPVEAPDEEE